MRILQMSDVHVGSGLFRQDLLEATIEESNALEPDLVAIVGDLTMEGYRWEFEEARQYFDRLECPNVIYAMGNHDAKNVGYRHFEEFFGIREGSDEIPVPEGVAKVVVLDSTKPDLDEGEVGREHYGWLDSEFRGLGQRPEDTDDPPPHPGRARHRPRREQPARRRRRDGHSARAQGGHGPLGPQARPLRLEHLGGEDRALRHRIHHEGQGHDAAFLQRYRDRRTGREDHTCTSQARASRAASPSPPSPAPL